VSGIKKMGCIGAFSGVHLGRGATGKRAGSEAARGRVSEAGHHDHNIDDPGTRDGIYARMLQSACKGICRSLSLYRMNR